MARSLILCSLAFVLTFGGVGCQSVETPRNAPSAGRPVRLQAFGDPAELSAYKELIAAFERANPDVKVAFSPVGKQQDHMAKLTTGFSGGDPPDLFLINFRRFGQFAGKDVLEPLGPRMAERGRLKESDLYEQPVEAFRYGGTLMCVPQNVSSLVVYYNRALFERAGVAPPREGWTWDDFLAAAKALTKDTDGDGRIDVYGLGFEPTLIRLARSLTTPTTRRASRSTSRPRARHSTLSVRGRVRTKSSRRSRRTNLKITSRVSRAAASA